MSDDAKTLLYWISNAECSEYEDSKYCYKCARSWAAYIIGS